MRALRLVMMAAVTAAILLGGLIVTIGAVAFGLVMGLLRSFRREPEPARGVSRPPRARLLKRVEADEVTVSDVPRPALPEDRAPEV